MKARGRTARPAKRKLAVPCDNRELDKINFSFVDSDPSNELKKLKEEL
jgi:hypothetical protein